MNRGRDRRQIKLDSQDHYKELEESHDAKAREISYTTSLSELFSGGLLAEDGSRRNEGSRCRWTRTF